MIYEYDFNDKLNRSKVKQLIINSCYLCSRDRNIVFQCNFNNNLTLLINENEYDLTAHVYFYNKETGDYKNIKNKNNKIDNKDVLSIINEETMETLKSHASEIERNEYFRRMGEILNKTGIVENYLNHIEKYQNCKFDKDGKILEDENEMG